MAAADLRPMERERRVLQHALDAAVRAEDNLEAARLRDLLQAMDHKPHRPARPQMLLSDAELITQWAPPPADSDPRSVRLQMLERMQRWEPTVQSALLDLLEHRLGHRPGTHALRTHCVRVLMLSTRTVHYLWEGDRVMTLTYPHDPTCPPTILPEP